VANQSLLKQISVLYRRINPELRRKLFSAVPRFHSSLNQSKGAKQTTTLIALMLIIVTVSSLMTAEVLSASQTSRTLSNKGNIGTLQTIGVEVYTDASLSSKVTLVTWGTLFPGTQTNFGMYIRNEGNTPVTLSQSVSNWNPTNAATYLNLTWNYTGQTLAAGQGVQVTLTLTVSENISGITDFSFNINVVGTG
jgi:hypothetical protein